MTLRGKTHFNKNKDIQQGNRETSFEERRPQSFQINIYDKIMYSKGKLLRIERSIKAMTNPHTLQRRTYLRKTKAPEAKEKHQEISIIGLSMT